MNMQVKHRTWLTALSVLVLPMVWLTGCASSPSRLSVPIAGGQTVQLERQGTGFKHAENDRVIITEASLEAVNLDGKNYLRWNFVITPKQTTTLNLIRIEDVSDSAPLIMVNDVAPQLDAGKWTETAGLMDVSGPSVRWLFQANDSVRVFRITINEMDGQSAVLYQGVQYTPASKEAIRAMIR
jgi:hypothetical protein